MTQQRSVNVPVDERGGEPVGWVYFLNARKAHYIVGVRALCGKWMYLGSGQDARPPFGDRCRACQRDAVKGGYERRAPGQEVTR